MKTLIIGVLVALFATPVAFAQSDSQDDPAPAATTQAAAGAAPSFAQAAQGAARSAAAPAAKTRADVYHELVHAEHDGEMQDLNRTVFFGQ